MGESPIDRVASPEVQALPARLISVVQELSLARDLPTIQAIVRREARALTGADGATFVLRDGDQCYYADEDAIAPLWKGRRFRMETCISGWSMLNRASTVIPDIYADDRIPADAYRPTFVKSLVMVPIRQRDPVGAIGNYWATPHRASDEEVAVLQALADSTAIAIENADLYANLERRVRDRTQTLEAMIAELEAFSYCVSHDLRAPLRTIQGFAEILQEEHGPELTQDARHCAERVSAGAKQMGQLIEGLLSLSRAGRGDLHKERVDLSALAHEVHQELSEANPGRQVEFRVQDGLQAEGDGALLRAVLTNLLGNAWKFTRGLVPAVLQVEGAIGEGELIVSVRDNGVGFDADRAPQIFSPFKRLHSEAFEGNGIGLSIVQRVIHRHGGRVWAEGAVDRGATFRFTLPLGSRAVFPG